MKLLDKLKDILFDEEEEEVEENVVPKKVVSKPMVEETKVVEEEVAPKKVEAPSTVDNHVDLDNTFKFPLFDEQEFESTKPKTKVEVKKNFGLDEVDNYRSEFRREEKRPVNNYNTSKDYEAILNEKPQEKGSFKPSPIISPVYGILNKNYDKDSIKVVSEVNTTTIPSKPKTLNVDDVRRKAFGQLNSEINALEETKPTTIKITEITTNPTVEEPVGTNTMELKETLTGIRENLENISDKMADIETKVDNHLDNEEELDKPRSAVELLNQIEEELDKTLELRKQDLDEIKDDYLDDFDDVKFDDEETVDDVIDEVDNTPIPDEKDDITDPDNDELFNLIDAMYDGSDDEDKDSEE